MPISKSRSASLDLLRAGTASAVALYHVHWFELDGGALWFLTPKMGHTAVIVFFVLSGFVIRASTRLGSSALDYAIKRVSRVYSVAVPALLSILALGYLARAAGVATPDAYQLRQPVAYLGLHLLFAGDLWSLAITAFSIGPYWSLNYEVWYYVAFGVATFTRGWARVVAVLAVLLVMGPKIVLLLPVWLAGAWVYELSRVAVLPRGVARWLAVGSLVALIAFAGSAWDEALNPVGARLGEVVGVPLRFSQWFVADYVRGALTAALVWALCSAEVRWPGWLVRWGRALADVSFSLYLMHYPLMAFFKSVLPGTGPLAAVLGVGLSLIFGAVVEPQRARLRRFLTSVTRRRALS